MIARTGELHKLVAKGQRIESTNDISDHHSLAKDQMAKMDLM